MSWMTSTLRAIMRKEEASPLVETSVSLMECRVRPAKGRMKMNVRCGKCGSRPLMSSSSKKAFNLNLKWSSMRTNSIMR